MKVEGSVWLRDVTSVRGMCVRGAEGEGKLQLKVKRHSRESAGVYLIQEKL